MLRAQFDQNKDVRTTFCGFRVVGRPKMAQLKLRLHRKNCDICSMFQPSEAPTNVKGRVPVKIKLDSNFTGKVKDVNETYQVLTTSVTHINVDDLKKKKNKNKNKKKKKKNRK